MFKCTINGPTAPLGAIKSGRGFVLTNFATEELSFNIKDAHGKTIPKKPVNVEKTIREALRYIDTHCGSNAGCNQYFQTLSTRTPITLRRILDEKNLEIYCLGGKEDRDLPAGFTHGWGPTYAQIGLSCISVTDSGNVASVLLHELAHVAGAPGKDEAPDSLAAELALKFCHVKGFDKNATG